MEELNEGNTTSTPTLQQALNSILGYLEQGNTGHYNIGRLYNYIVGNELAEKNGYESAQQFFSQHVKELSQATLSRYGAVAREFTEAACTRYGVMKLTTLRTYAQVVNIQPVSGDPGPTPIDVPQEGGSVVRKLFSECSVEELKLAVKNKRQPSQATMPVPDTARVELMRASLSRYFAQGARVQLKTSIQRGKTLVTIQGVPLAEMERLMEALLEGLMPQPVRVVG